MNMKTFRPILIATAIVLAGVSCTKQSPAAPESSGNLVPMTFSASSADAFTKTSVNGVNVLWSESDKIAVFDDVASKPNEFSLTGGAGTVSGKFEGSVSKDASEFYAIYPYSAEASCSDGQFETIIPTDQSATAKDISANVMVAKADADGKLNFKNATALIQFTVTATDIYKITFSGNNAEDIAGAALISYDGGSAPEVVAGKKNIEIQATEDEGQLPGGTYYLALAPVSFTKGFRLTFYDADNETEVVGVNAVSLAPGDKLNLGTIDLTPWKTTVTLDKNAMATVDDSRTAVWSFKLQKGNIVNFANFDANVSEMLNLAVFTDIDDKNHTARYIGADQDYEVYYLTTQKWILLTSNYLQADRWQLIGQNCSFAQSPYTEYPLIDSTISPVTGQALPLNKVSEGIFRAYIYLADNFAIHLYAGTAWGNLVKNWTSGSPDYLVAKADGNLYYGVQDVTKTFTPGIYLVEYNKTENKITFSK